MKKLPSLLILWLLSLSAIAQSYTTILQGQIFPASPNLSVANLTVRVYPDSLANPGFQPYTLQSDALGMVYDTLTLNGSGVVKVDLIGCNGLPGNAFVLPVSPSVPLSPFAFLYFCQPNPANCVASFTVTPDTIFNLPGVFFFNSTSTQVGPNTQYSWDFGDGNLGNGPNMTHVYNLPGVYLAHLYLTDPAGCSAIASQTVVVNSVPSTGTCHAFFTYSGAPVSSTPATVTFQNHSAFNPQSSFIWSFGDGSSSILENPMHTYNANGIFAVSLTQTDTATNCSSTYTDTVFIGQAVGLCSVSFTAAVDPFSPNVIAFRSLPITSGGSIQYNWDFGTGGFVNQDNPNVFLPNGTYNVCLTITTTRGCVATFCDTVVVNGGGGASCEAQFAYQASANNQPLDIDFFNASPFIPGQLPIDSILWDFGDGSPVVTQNSFPTHSFPAFGTYNVCMSIFTANCSDITCEPITLLPNINTPYKLLGSVLGIPPTPGNQVSVVLFELVNQSWQVRDSFLTVVPGLFLYTFDSLPAGVYSVRAELSPSSPDFLNFFPTYLGNSITWTGATGIALGPQNPIGLTAIFMVANNNPGNGGGNIMGNVGMANGFRTSQVSSLDAMRVQLLDASAQPLYTVQVAANGNFSFQNLPFGDYLVHVDWPGMPCTPFSVSLSPEQPSLNGLNFHMSAIGITASLVSSNNTTTLVYPNPIGERLTIEKRIDAVGTYELLLTDVAGRLILRQNYQLGAGNQRLELQTESLRPGSYLLYLNSPDKTTEFFKLIR